MYLHYMHSLTVMNEMSLHRALLENRLIVLCQGNPQRKNDVEFTGFKMKVNLTIRCKLFVVR